MSESVMALVSSRTGWMVALVVALTLAGLSYVLLAGPEEVQMACVEERDVAEFFVATGQLTARYTSNLGPEVGGTVETLHVKAGDRVAAGDPVAELTPRDAQIAIEKASARVKTLEDEYRQAKTGATRAEIDAVRAQVAGEEATLQQAERVLVRARKLNRQGLTTTAEVESGEASVERAKSRLNAARAELKKLRELPRPELVSVARSRLEQAQLELKEAKGNLEKTVLKAPFKGLVLSVDANPGERMGPGQTVVRLADMSTVEVRAEIDEDFFGRVETGQSANMVFPSLKSQTFPAVVTQVGPEVDPERGTVSVHLRPKELPEAAFPGLTVDVTIAVTRLSAAVALPGTAIAQDSEGTYVVTIEDETAVRVPVEILARGEEWTAISRQNEVSDGQCVVRNAAVVEIGSSIRAADQDREP